MGANESVEREEDGADRPSSCKGKPPDFTQTKRPAKPSTDYEDWKCRGCGFRNTAKDLRCRTSYCYVTKIVSTSWDSIRALPLSAADMRKSWHKDFPQAYRVLRVCLLVAATSTGDPAEDIKDLVTDAQKTERNTYESANIRYEYLDLMVDKRSELRKKRMSWASVSSSTDLSSQHVQTGSSMTSRREVKMEEKPQGTVPLHVEMEEHPVTESESSPHPSLELQDEIDLSSCFSGLRIEESISRPRSHSLPSLIPCLENKTGFIAKRSHSLNDVTLLVKTQKITPDIIVVKNQESYRFNSTQAGLFQCSVTGLVFKMKAEGDVTYRTVPWHRRLLSQIEGKRPAGPLFDIKGSQRYLCQLRFPHCEILSTGAGKFLSVVHVMDDGGLEFIKPHMITETHVIIGLPVTGFSLFGIIMQCFPIGLGPVQPSPFQTISRPFLSRPFLSRPFLSRPFLSRPFLSSPVLSSPVLPPPVLSRQFLTRQFLSSPFLTVQTIPGRTSPVQTILAQPSPEQTIPAQTILVQTIPVQTIPVQTSPVQNIPVQPTPVQALVALFYKPPIDDDHPSSILKVLLLPRNVLLSEVQKKRRKLENGEEIYIGIPPCKLIPKQEYTLSTSPQDNSIKIQPNEAEFEVDESSYHNYIETFDVILKRRFSSVILLLRSSKTSDCPWEREVDLSAAALRKQQVQHTLSLEVEERLFSVRDSFIGRVSLPNINCLVDKLFSKKVLNDAEREAAAEMQSRNAKARFVIDTVRRKGPDACSTMIVILCGLDTLLSEHLGLM